MNKLNEFTIPATSTCIIKTVGEIHDGDEVIISSPVFPSINYTYGPINTSETFSVIAHLASDETIVSNGNTRATLRCYDNDPFRMHVCKLIQTTEVDIITAAASLSSKTVKYLDKNIHGTNVQYDGISNINKLTN